MDEAQILKVIDKKLQPLCREIRDKLSTVDELEKSVQHLSDSYDEFQRKLSQLELSETDLTRENTRAYSSYVHNVMNELEQTKKTLDDLEQYIRRECLEIRGFPTLPNENTNEIVRNIGKLVDVDIKAEDISISHRLPSMKSSSYAQTTANKNDDAIIVKFVKRDTRDEFYQARNKLRAFTTRNLGIVRHTDQKLYISESLTRRNKDLFKASLNKKKELNYRFLWTKYGKILMRKSESSPVHTFFYTHLYLCTTFTIIICLHHSNLFLQVLIRNINIILVSLQK